MHCHKNFPFKKEKSDLDIHLTKDIEDDEYLSKLSIALKEIESFRSDLIFYQAGVDVLAKDRYGKINLTLDGVKKRNHMVYNFAIKRNNPILIFMGGGYSIPIDYTVKAFVELFKDASKIKYT